MKTLKELGQFEKAAVLDSFIDHIEGINAKYGSVMGTIQIRDKLDEIAVSKGFLSCPYCGRRS
jgi:predicted molibdopterin-dependent oxidoreductase YjgC